MKLRIALADLAYLNAENAGNLYVPLSIGFLAATAKKRFGPDVEVRIFKDPEALLRHCRDNVVHIVGLSLYHWSLGLTDMVARKIAAMTPRPLMVGGGPCIDSDAVEQAKFLARHPFDIVVPNEGEDAFCNIIADVLGGGSGKVKVPLGLSTDLALVPSPYLDGTLDEFLDGPFQPMTQTSRLCPYTCLTGDTPVNTMFGNIPIRELAEEFGDAGVPVYTFDPVTRVGFIADSIRIRKYGVDQPLVRVHFDDGTHIDCTPDHRFLQFSRGRQWECEAGDLAVGARVRALRVEINPNQRAYVNWTRRGRRLRSRMVKEYEIGRRLTRAEHVHHRDHDTLNDLPENLELCASAADHAQRHPELAERMRLDNPTKNGMSQEWRDNLAAANRGKVRSLASRLRYRDSKLGDKNPNFKDGASGGRSRIAEVNHKIVGVEWLAERGDVYCLTVPATGWFYVNNVLVKNCAFCVSGKSRGKLRAFELDQLREEWLYIGKRFADRPQHIMYLTDENFGIMQRDLQAADLILEARAKTGYPQKIFYYQDKRFTRVARELHEKVGDMCYHGCMLSLQSENPETLKAIKRRNLTDEQITDAISWARGIGIKTSTELIFGLPMETRESFTGLLDKCARHGFDAVQCYNLILFDGIEMNRPAYRVEHQLETRWRSIAGHQQMIEGEAAIEFEEVVISSNHFSFEDYKLIRKLNVFFHAFFVGHVCTDMVRGLIAGGVGLTDIVKTLLENPVNEAHRAFLADLDAEVGGALFTVEQRDAARAAGKLLPPHIKIQPHFAARIERERDLWLAEALERSSRMVYEVAAE